MNAYETQGRAVADLAAERGWVSNPFADDDGPNGAALLDELHAALVKYVILPSAEAADAVTLYIAATHAQPVWEHAARLVIKSPLRRCGKTRLQEVCRELVHNPLPTTNISPAALTRSIDEDDPPTLILDEADTVWGKKDQRSEGAEDIRGILNSGHSRGWPYVRWDAAARRRELCPTFAMAIIGGIGDMPDTIEDRAVVISMRRRAPGEQVAPWRSRRSIPELRAIRDQLHDWVRAHLSELEDAEPDVPVEDRAADVWEPLVAIADLAGGAWPERARQACKVLSGSNDPEDGTASERLLADLRDVFGTAANLATTSILDALCRIEEAPWGTWHRGEKLSPRGLAALLRPYGIRSKNLKIAGQVVKGYARVDMVDAWQRYLPLPATEGASAQVRAVADEVADDPETAATGLVADAVADDSETAATGVDQPKLIEVAQVAPVAAGRLDRAVVDHSPRRACRACGEPIDPAAGDIHPACEGERTLPW